jgi:hypothetical protein
MSAFSDSSRHFSLRAPLSLIAAWGDKTHKTHPLSCDQLFFDSVSAVARGSVSLLGGCSLRASELKLMNFVAVLGFWASTVNLYSCSKSRLLLTGSCDFIYVPSIKYCRGDVWRVVFDSQLPHDRNIQHLDRAFPRLILHKIVI